MLNVNISISDCKTGFPQCIRQHRVRFTNVGDFETALNDCIDQFDAYAKRRTEGDVFQMYADEIMCGMAQLKADTMMMTVIPSDERHNVIIICAQDK